MTHYLFGTRSLEELETCSYDIQDVSKRALELSPYDFSIVRGWDGEEVQNALHASGASTKKWPYSKHNNTIDVDGRSDVPFSLAVDFAPYIKGKIPWKDTHIFAAIAGCYFAAAIELNVKLRWGGDWDSDGSTTDQKLMDWGHIELA